MTALAGRLRERHRTDTVFAAAAFEYVRDRVRSGDVGDRRVTPVPQHPVTSIRSVSETLREGVGLCYSKAHLLTALLRAQEIPTGLCYRA